MSLLRDPSTEELAVISALVQAKPETRQYVGKLVGLRVEEMADGGMGSLLLVPKGAGNSERFVGKKIVAGDFKDTDGVLVSVTVNVDDANMLYELDIWKVDFSPLLHWPDPSTINITG